VKGGICTSHPGAGRGAPSLVMQSDTQRKGPVPEAQNQVATKDLRGGGQLADHGCPLERTSEAELGLCGVGRREKIRRERGGPRPVKWQSGGL